MNFPGEVISSDIFCVRLNVLKELFYSTFAKHSLDTKILALILSVITDAFPVGILRVVYVIILVTYVIILIAMHDSILVTHVIILIPIHDSIHETYENTKADSYLKLIL